MRGLRLAWLLPAVCFCGVLGPGPFPACRSADAPAEPDVDRLIEQLGSRSFEVREAATRQLKVREDAAPALRRALKSPDPEVARRAALILEEFAARSELRKRARLRGLAKNGEVDQAVELLVRRQTWFDEDVCWQAMAELAGKLLDLEKQRFGKASVLNRPELYPVYDFRRFASMNKPRRLASRRSELDGEGAVLVRAEEVVAPRMGVGHSLICAAESVLARDLGGCVVFANGPIEVKEAHGLVVVCDGDFTATEHAGSCLIIARGAVRCAGIVKDCRIVASGGVHYAERTKVSDTKVEEGEATPLGFVRFFDPSFVGVEVVAAEDCLRVKAVHEGKPFARAGLRADDIVLSLDETAVNPVESFRRLLRKKVAEGGDLVLKVRRADNDLDVRIQLPN